MSADLTVHVLRLESRKVQLEAAALRARLDAAVVTARRAGASWTEVGAALGVSAQAAWKRYAAVVAVAEPRLAG
jgi:hypothetical protein